jgi:hypothetical protein
MAEEYMWVPIISVIANEPSKPMNANGAFFDAANSNEPP